MIQMEQNDLLKPNLGIQQNLPNATAALILGIISIVATFCYGIGIICGIVGMVLANRDRKLYQATPELYSAASYGTCNAGRTCSIIGIILSSLFIIVIVFCIIFFSAFITSHGLRY